MPKNVPDPLNRQATQSRAAPTPCRWLWDDPAGGAWNMALDEALLEAADTDGIATLRCYRWSQPTLSLGYFQRADERHGHVASRACPMVRRASGGGAILHDSELTYSLAIPTADRLAAAACGLYDVIHAALVEAISAMGVPVSVHTDSASQPNPPFLCFQRHGPGDIMLGSAKIAGSAQRRHRGAILQHGSILLATSRCAPELPGLAELTGHQIDPSKLAFLFRRSLCIRLKLECEQPTDSGSDIPAALLQRARIISAEKFATASWTNRR
jgi:lipoate-protein ligase A